VKKNLPAAVSTAALVVALICQAPPAGAQETHEHHHDQTEKLGRVNFNVSCTPEAQRQFNRAVAWLHSFEYEEAEKAFAEVTATDPRCGMGYWGVAMSNYHPLWAPPTAAELQKGARAVEQAKSVGARTQRERDYIAAVELFYKDSDKLDHRARSLAYGEAMGQLSRRYPSDREAGVFYALTLIAKGAAAEAFAVRNHMPGVWDEQLHAMDYLAYAYLQGAQDVQARGVLDELNRIRRVDPQTFKVAYAAAAIPARYALERRRWDEAARLTLQQGALGAFPWEQFRWAEAHVHFARAVGAARTGDTASARQEVEKLAAIRQALVEVRGGYDWAKQVEIERQVAAAWLAHAGGEREESLRLMRAAAELDDATEKHPVTPGAILPAREQLGELLLELKQPAAALREFETSLRSTPNRFNGLYGAARAAALAGDGKRAEGYYKQLVTLCSHADTDRPEIQEAKEFLAGGGADARK
jgi:tetratricopeptide (TPR) repeat protein